MFVIAWKEIQKNIFVIACFVVLTVVIVLAFNDYLPALFEEEREMLATNLSMMLGIFVNMLVFSSMMSSEKEEDQSNGYAFCRTLPIADWQIVLGKFFTTLVSALFSIVLVALVTSIFGGKLESKLQPLAYNILIAGVALVLVAILYLFSFRTRYSRLLPAVMVVYVLSILFPQVAHLALLILGYEQTVDHLFSQLTLSTGIIIFGICLLIFSVLAYFAIQVKKKVLLPE